MTFMGRKCPFYGINCYSDICADTARCKAMEKDEEMNKPTQIWCDKYHSYCSQSECLAAGDCIAMASEDDSNNVGVKLIQAPAANNMICPVAPEGTPNRCIDPGCLKSRECLDQKYGPVTSLSTTPVSASSGAIYCICPSDNKKCFTVSCKGGSECFMKRHNTNTPPPCHQGMHGLGFIGKDGKAEIVVGKEFSLKGWDIAKDGKIGMIIGLLGERFPQGDIVGFNEVAKNMGMGDLLVTQPIVPNIWIKWPDMGVVPFDKAWWQRLVEVIGTVEGAVCIYCMGGHGRTGTAASIICSLAGLVPEGEDPVKWVRVHYCDKAVETKGQIEYIEKITGRKVTVNGGKEYTVSSSYSSWSSEEKRGKKKAGGNIGGSGSKKKGKGPSNTQKGDLSINKWRSWWKVMRFRPEFKALEHVTRPQHLPDNQEFTIGKSTYRWSVKDHCFTKV